MRSLRPLRHRHAAGTSRMQHGPGLILNALRRAEFKSDLESKRGGCMFCVLPCL